MDGFESGGVLGFAAPPTEGWSLGHVTCSSSHWRWSLGSMTCSSSHWRRGLRPVTCSSSHWRRGLGPVTCSSSHWRRGLGPVTCSSSHWRRGLFSHPVVPGLTHVTLFHQWPWSRQGSGRTLNLCVAWLWVLHTCHLLPFGGWPQVAVHQGKGHG
jgi:hypothetical protein